MFSKTKITALLLAIFSTIANCYSQTECVTAEWTLNPEPVDGGYIPGQIVEMCITISDYNPTSGNSMHGVIPVLPSGWDLFSITPVTSPEACSASGSWNWYQSVVSGSNGQVYGPGYFFNTGADNNPGNNFGDLCDDEYDLQFCVSVALQANCGGSGNPLNGDLITPGFRITTDGLTGNWDESSPCESATTYPDTDVAFDCCIANTGNADDEVVVCGTDEITLMDFLTDNPDDGGTWTRVSDGAILPDGIFVPFEHPGGMYRYTIEGDGCVAYTDLMVNATSNPNPGVSTVDDICSNQPVFDLIVLLDGTPDLGGTWTNSDGTEINGDQFDPATAESDVYTYTVTGGELCPIDASASVDLEIETCTDITELNKAGIQLFPNPAEDHVTLDLISFTGKINAELYDLTGKKVFSAASLNGNRLHKFDIADLTPGVYILNLHNAVQDWSVRIIKN